MRRRLLLTCLGLSAILFIRGPAGAPSAAADEPATTQPLRLTPASDVDQILDVLDARGRDLRDFKARVRMSDIEQVSGESTIFDGAAVFQRSGPAGGRIRVKFTSKQVGNRIDPTYNKEYTLDSRVLVERDYVQKKEVRYELSGEETDLLKLGKGPFPLPIGQKKEDVKKVFDVKKFEPARGDPTNCDHILLTPLSAGPYAGKFARLNVWVSLENGMPRRIQQTPFTASTSAPDEKVTDLTNVEINTGVGDGNFALPPLPLTGWTKISQKYAD